MNTINLAARFHVRPGKLTDFLSVAATQDLNELADMELDVFGTPPNEMFEALSGVLINIFDPARGDRGEAKGVAPCPD